MATTETKAGRASKAAADRADKAVNATFDAAEKAFSRGKRDAADASSGYTKFEVPEVFRSFAEQGLNQSREAYSRLKVTTEEATDTMEESFETTRDGMREVQFKVLDAAKANADATFDFMRQLLGATTMADAMQLQTAFVRERFEAMIDYSKDVQSTVSKVGAEASKPAKVLFERALSQTKSA